MTLAQPRALAEGGPRRPRGGIWRRLRDTIVAAPIQAAITIAVLAVAALGIARALRWAVFDAVFVAASPDACRGAAGACWAIVTSNARVIAFGLYPTGEQWRPFAALVVVLAAAAIIVAFPRLRRLLAIPLALATAGIFLVLMGGGRFGLAPVPLDRWGGLPLSILVFAGTVVLGFPLSILLALGRRSSLPLVRIVCTGLIEGVRAVPLLTVLFCAAVVAPLVVPGWLNPDKIVRIVVAMALFYACYQAEVVRGALQGVPAGQREAAMSLGLRPLHYIWLVELPIALRIAVPATVNLLVVAFKDTSMVITVGLFDFVATANTAITGDAWAPYFVELYLFVALVYLVGTGAITAWGHRLERELKPHG